jgi:N6-adenosine-specific RNA methylase IME4
MTSTRPVSSIRVGQRHRRDMGDIEQLRANIADVGLLLPVVVTPGGELVDGARRLQACEQLGMATVPVHVVDIDGIVRGELAANVYRKAFTPSEMVAITATVEERERELARQRMTLGKISTGSQTGKTRDKVATPLGVSGRTLEKARAVVQAAEAEPDTFGPLVTEMDRTGKVNAAHRALRRIEDEKRITHLVHVAGKFKTLVLDPPWQYDGLFLGRGGPDYATMSHEQLLALPVPSWAEDNCHLYLWTTNAMFPAAIELMAKWEFRFNTVLTWAKPHYGMGVNFRGQTEHVLFGIRGTLRTRVSNIGTWFAAPVGEHSEKPEKFYDIVRAASYPPYGEAFARKARPDFVDLYEQKEMAPNADIHFERLAAHEASCRP